MGESIWTELQIPETKDIAEIRRAYARRLKQVHPEDDRDGFQRLRQAYESAIFLSAITGIELNLIEAIPQTAARALPKTKNSSTATENLEVVLPPEERAEQLVQSVFEAAATNEKMAARQVADLLDSEELENIELRILFEERLLNAFAQREPLPASFLEEAAEMLGWERAASRSLDRFSLQYLLSRLEGWRAYKKLITARDARHSVTNASLLNTAVSPLQARAASMLTHPYDSIKFQWNRIRYPRLLKSVKDLIERLQAFAPDAIQYHLDQRTVQWWSARKIDPVPLFGGIAFSVGLLIFFVVMLGEELFAIWELWAAVLGFGFLLLIIRGLSMRRAGQKFVHWENAGFGRTILFVLALQIIQNPSTLIELWPLCLALVAIFWLFRSRSQVLKWLRDVWRFPNEG